MADFLFSKVAFIGFGLIGSSLARSLRKHELAKEISVCEVNPEYRRKAAELALADEYTGEASDAVKDADLVMLCAPVGATAEIIKKIAPHLTKGTIISDVGSVKMSVLKDALPHLPEGVEFVAGHPVAGTENSGPAAGFAELFEGRWCILTPTEKNTPEALKKISAMWQKAGMQVETMTAEHHDRVMAVVSHVPHLIAYTIVGTADDMETHFKQEVIKYSASGFRDFTRIAASDPTMWRDIFLTNGEAVLEVLQRFSEDLTALQRAIRWKEGDKLFDLFARTRTIRREVIEARQHVMENEKTILAKP